MKSHRFKYTAIQSFPGGMPFVDIQLTHSNRQSSVSALVDSGSALNILPLDVGLGLGLNWETQTFPLDVRGALKGIQAYAVLVRGELAPFPSLDLAFAWVSKPSSEVPAILGQVNFFQEFDVLFYGHQQAFDIIPRSH